MTPPRIAFPIAAAALLASGVASANEAFEIRAKEGVSNIRVAVIFEKDSTECLPEALARLKSQVAAVAGAYFARNIDVLRKNAGSTASRKGEYFITSYTARCDGDGSSIWFAGTDNPDSDQQVYDPSMGWICLRASDGSDCPTE